MTPLLLASLALAEPCALPASADSLAESLAAAEAAWIAMDLDGFASARARAERQLECQDHPLAPPVAAAFHRLQALAAFAEERDADVVSGYRAARALEPAYTLPVSLAPPGHPLLRLYGEAALRPEGETAPSPPEGVWVDGTEGAPRALTRPVVLQHADRRGRVEESLWLPAQGAPPPWAVVEPASTHRKTPWFVASGAGALAAGGLYGLAWSQRAAWEDPDTPLGELDALQARTNGLVVASAVAGGVAAGLFAAGVAW